MTALPDPIPPELFAPATGFEDALKGTRPQAFWADAWRRFRRNPAAMASLAEGIQGLVKNMRGEQQMLRDWIEAQQDEAKAMRRTLDKLSSRISGGERITVAGERSSLSAKLGQLDETGGE